MATMMRCGHAAQGTTGTGEPVCVICAGLTPDARVVADQAEAVAALAGREMRCSYLNGRDGRPCAGRTPRPSDPSAAFFGHRPGEEFDSFYDGCWGWD
jgi:hypothetical protein